VARKLKKANCHGLGFALETGDPDILKFMNKANTVSEFVDQCHVLHEASVDVYTSIIVGYPQEPRKHRHDVSRAVGSARLPECRILQLMPKTPNVRLRPRLAIFIRYASSSVMWPCSRRSRTSAFWA